MSKTRDSIFTVTCPAPELVQTVTLYHDTWHGKISQKHELVAGLLSEVEDTIIAPSAIASSRTVAGHLVFINESVTSPSGSAHLRVAVDPGQGSGTVKTVYFGRRQNEPIAWRPPTKGQGR